MKFTFFIILLIVFNIQSLPQTIDKQNIGKSLSQNSTIAPSPDGALHLNIPLLSVPGSRVFAYPFVLSYKSGVQYYDKGAPAGVGWNFPVYSIRRTVRVYPDEYEHLCYQANYDTVFYKRVGVFGWMDYMEYSDVGKRIGPSASSLGNINNMFCQGYFDAMNGDEVGPEYVGGHVTRTEIPDVIEQMETDVPDMYEINAPGCSGRLVYHHFDMDNPYLPKSNSFSNIPALGRKDISIGFTPDSLAPHYRLYFYPENDLGIIAILHIRKNWHQEDVLQSFRIGNLHQPETWWEVFLADGTQLYFGQTEESHSNDLGIKYTTTQKYLDGEPLEGTQRSFVNQGIENGWQISSTSWYLDKMKHQASGNSDSVTFHYSTERREYKRYSRNYHYSGNLINVPNGTEMVMGVGVKGNVGRTVLTSVETISHALRFTYAKPLERASSVNYLRGVSLIKKSDETALRNVVFNYKNHFGDDPFLTGRETTDFFLLDKIMLTEIIQSGMGGESIPGYVMGYNIPESGSFNPDLWGFNNKNLPFNLFSTDINPNTCEGSNLENNFGPGSLPNLEFNNGHPSSADWSLKSIYYPTGLLQSFYYSPAGEQLDNCGFSDIPFQSTVLDTIVSGRDGYTRCEKTIGGPPALVCIQNLDKNGKKYFTNYKYSEVTAKKVPYAKVSFEVTGNGFLNKSVFSRFSPYPSMPSWSVMDLSRDSIYRTRDTVILPSGIVSVTDSIHWDLIGEAQDIAFKEARAYTDLVFYDNPDNPGAGANYLASFYNMVYDGVWNINSIFSYNSIYVWQSTDFDSAQAPTFNSCENALSGIELTKFTTFMCTNPFREITEKKHFASNADIASNNYNYWQQINFGSSWEPSFNCLQSSFSEFGEEQHGINGKVYNLAQAKPLLIESVLTKEYGIAVKQEYGYDFPEITKDYWWLPYKSMQGINPGDKQWGLFKVFPHPGKSPYTVTSTLLRSPIASDSVLSKELYTYRYDPFVLYNYNSLEHSLFIVNQPVSTKLLGSNSAEILVSENEYNNFGFLSETRFGDKITSCNYSYDEYGNVLSFTDALGAIHRFTYSNFGLTRDSVFVKGRLLSSAEYEPNYFAIAKSTDHILNRTVYSDYDGLGRISSMYDSMGIGFDYSYFYGRNAADPTIFSPNSITISENFMKSTPHKYYNFYFDGFGNKIQENTGTFSDYNYQAFCYDELGRITKTFTPYKKTDNVSGVYDPEFLNHTKEYTDPLANWIQDNSSALHIPYSTTNYYKYSGKQIQSFTPPGYEFKDKNTSYHYGTNALNEMRQPARTLKRTLTINENNDTLLLFQDPLGYPAGNSQLMGDGTKLTTLVSNNPAGKPVSTISPEGKETFYYYNNRGLLENIMSPIRSLSYTYDAANNIKDCKTGAGILKYTNFYDSLNRITSVYHEQKKVRAFSYDVADGARCPETQRNVSGKLSYTTSKDGDNTTSHTTEFYSYDDRGRVEWKICSNNAKTIKILYTYHPDDLIASIELFSYSTGTIAKQNFEYNAMRQLSKIYIDHQHPYVNLEYFASGQTKRMVLGDTIQGVDYRYNPRGWLCQINSPIAASYPDPGGDGSNSIKGDKFGLMIGYNNIMEIGAQQSVIPQYNGDVSWYAYRINAPNSNSDIAGYSFKYDKAHRLINADFGYFNTTLGNWNSSLNYDMQLNYSPDGNIMKLYRNGNNGNPDMDKLTYNYNVNSDKLNSISDSVNAAAYAGDIDSQNSNNYAYDESGNVIKDLSKNISQVNYNCFDQPVALFNANNSPIAKYYYNVNGKRSRKDVYNNSSYTSTRYFYGTSGELLAIMDPTGAIYMNIYANGILVGQIKGKGKL